MINEKLLVAIKQAISDVEKMSENELRAELALLSGGLLERAVRPQLSPQNESVSVGQYVIVWNGFSSSITDCP